MKPAMKSDVGECVLASSPNLKTYEEIYSRVKCDYRDLSEKFKNNKKDFSKQYAHIYASRSSKTRAHLLNRVRTQWGNDIEVKKLADLQEESDSERCVIVGIIYKHQELHPSILKDISEEGAPVNLLLISAATATWKTRWKLWSRLSAGVTSAPLALIRF
ncbi:unnamed protein product, partial [Nesidiocoris tenuis]